MQVCSIYRQFFLVNQSLRPDHTRRFDSTPLDRQFKLSRVEWALEHWYYWFSTTVELSPRSWEGKDVRLDCRVGSGGSGWGGGGGGGGGSFNRFSTIELYQSRGYGKPQVLSWVHSSSIAGLLDPGIYMCCILAAILSTSFWSLTHGGHSKRSI